MQICSSMLMIPLRKQKNKPKTALQAPFRLTRFQSEVRRTAPGTRRFNASLTVEAALVLPLFLFAMYLLNVNMIQVCLFLHHMDSDSRSLSLGGNSKRPQWEFCFSSHKRTSNMALTAKHTVAWNT